MEVTNYNTHKTCNGVGVVGMINIMKKIGFLFAFNFYLIKKVKTLCDTSLLLKYNYLNKVIPNPLRFPC